MKKLYIIPLLFAFVLSGCVTDKDTQQSAPKIIVEQIEAPVTPVAKSTGIRLQLLKTDVVSELRMPFISRIPPQYILHTALYEHLINYYDIVGETPKHGLVVKITLNSITYDSQIGRLLINVDADVKDLKGHQKYNLIGQAPIQQNIVSTLTNFSPEWSAAMALAMSDLSLKLTEVLQNSEAKPFIPPKHTEIRGYVADMYINKDIHRIIIDAKTAKVYSVNEIDNVPVDYVLYAIARGRGFKAALADIDILREDIKLMQFFERAKIGIVIINADRTTTEYDPDNARLANKMGAKGALTYIMSDRNGKQHWHIFGRLNHTVLKQALPAESVAKWVDELYKLTQIEQKDNLDWFAPYIDSNAY